MPPAVRLQMRITSALTARVVAVLFQLHAGEGALSSDGTACASAQKLFPIEQREGLLWVRVQVRQTPSPLNFLLDTGAGVSVLNLTTARHLGLHGGHPVAVEGVGGNSKGLWPQHLSAKAGGVTLPQNYLTLDLSALSESCACPVDGILGADFFRDRIVTIDFGAQVVKIESSIEHVQATDVIPMKTSNRALLVPVKVNTTTAHWFRLDTGCASALQWVSSEVPRIIGNQSAVALKRVSIDQTITSVKLGGTLFDKVPTGVHQQAIFGGEAGLVGNGLLSRFDAVTIDARGGRLLLRSKTPAEPLVNPALAVLAKASADTD